MIDARSGWFPVEVLSKEAAAEALRACSDSDTGLGKRDEAGLGNYFRGFIKGLGV